MRITKIDVTNFQGLHRAQLDLAEPLLLVAGPNGAGKSSLLDAISHALTGLPRRVAQKKDCSQLVTEGQKKGEAHVTYIDAAGEEQTAWAMLPSGKATPLADAPFLPFVLDASRFAAQKPDDRRRLLFDLTGATASPNEVAKRLATKGIDPARIEKVKPLLRSGFPAAVGQAKDYASEARGSWKATTGENYGSDKAIGWQPPEPAAAVSEQDIESARAELATAEQDLAEAQQTLGAHKQAANAAAQRQQRIEQLKELAAQTPRRAAKLKEDEARRDEWDQKLTDARRAADGVPQHEPLTCPHCKGLVDLQAGALVAHTAEQDADPDAAKRVTEYSGYLESALRAVANSQRDVKASEDAAAQITALEAEATEVPSAEAIANGESTLNDLRQLRDHAQAKVESLQDAFDAAAQRASVIEKAAGYHADVVAWGAVAEALSPTGIPAEILADAIGPMNALLSKLSATAGWLPVQIGTDIDVIYGARIYGLLSESERWRCDTTVALAIANLSKLGLVLLDRLDVLDLPSRGQALKLLRTATADGSLDTAIIAGTLKAPMTTIPAGMQAVWIESGHLTDHQHQAA